MDPLYATQRYAQALAFHGRPFYVPEWQTHLIIREFMPGITDAMGTYPISILRPGLDIQGGLDRLRSQQLVSVVLVLDDFNRPPLANLEEFFVFFRPFKTHYLFQAQNGPPCYDKHHRYELRQALKTIRVAPFVLNHHLAEWQALYARLIANKHITGIQAFSPVYHQALASFDEITAIGAWLDEELVSCHLWVQMGDYVFSHLAASSQKGYAHSAAYAVNDASLQYFRHAQTINLGGGAGQVDNKTDGLSRFKRGFSNGTAMSYLCGAILDEDRYAQLTKHRSATSSFFPAYRASLS